MKKRLFLLLFVFLLSVLVNLPSVSATEYSIYNWTDLQDMENDLDGDYYLENDLNSSTPGYADYQTGAGFEPIGADVPPYDCTVRFCGSFDGQNHTITGLFIDRSTTSNVGLFGYADGSEIKNVGLEDVDITGASKVGGLVGYTDGTISNSYSTGNVNGTVWYVGGLVGHSSGVINNSYSTGNVIGTTCVGGLVGWSYGGTVTNSYSTVSVNGSDEYVGGLVGYNQYGPISNSYSTGSVSGDSDVGGLVGVNSAPGIISNSYWNNCTENPDYCWTNSTGNYSIGCTAIQANVTYFYYSTNVPLSNWSFCNGAGTWAIDEGESYPCLNWEYDTCACHEAEAPVAPIPEFSTITALLALVIVISGFLVMRKRD